MSGDTPASAFALAGPVVTRLRAEVERLTGALSDETQALAQAIGRADKAESDLRQNRRYVDKATKDAIGATQLAIDARAEAATLREQRDHLLGELSWSEATAANPMPSSPTGPTPSECTAIEREHGEEGATPSEPSFADEMARGCAALDEEPGGA